MNHDDIIRMARDAGSIDSEEVIETLWKAFVAAEREALKAETARCAKVCEEFAQRCRDAGWDSEAAILRDAAKTMQE